MLEITEKKYGEFLSDLGIHKEKQKEVAEMLSNQTLDTLELSKIAKEQNLSRQDRTKAMIDLHQRNLAELSAAVGSELAAKIHEFGAAGGGYEPLADSFASRCSALGVQVSETLAADIGRTLKTTEAINAPAKNSRETRQNALNHVALRQASGKLTAGQLKVFQQMLDERQAEAQREAPPGT